MRKVAMRRHLPAVCLAALALLGMSSATAAPALGQDCPTGGVLDRNRAYFGPTLSINSCGSEGATCTNVFFFSDQRSATAVCRNGRWVPQGTTMPSTCPHFVFPDGQIWDRQGYRQNSCNSATAGMCENTYFYRLPGGGAGHATALCTDGRWQPEDSPSTPDSFRLRPVFTETELLSTLRDGLIETYTGRSPYAFGGPSGFPAEGPSGFDDSGGGGGSVPISETNVQEAGVDEEDRIETDGEFLYVLLSPSVPLPNEPGRFPRNQIRVLGIDPSGPSSEPVAEISVELEENQLIQGLYLRSEADQLVATAGNLGAGWYDWYSPFAWMGGQSSLATFDVANPAEPAAGPVLSMDGEIISTRRIDDTVYVATRFHPFIDDLDFYAPGSDRSAEVLARIAATGPAELLPKYRIVTDGVAGGDRLLVQPEDCYLPTESSPIRTADVISLVAIDLDTITVTSSKCFIGATETLYVSLESAFVASTRYGYSLVPGPEGPLIEWDQPQVQTDLHKFSLGDGTIRYEASGSVEGHLGWNLLRKPFRMSERGDDLRVITYTDELSADRSPVAVTVLRDVGDDRLRVVSRLPNAERPEPIGKPGEDLYATRFVGDLAYLVTFLITDPLYVVDLSDPLDPFVAGELEITGFSDYLHPIEGGYLVGVGKDAIPASPREGFRGAWYQGVKVSLYDVRDPGNPLEVDSVLLGKRGSDTPVLRDHRAFTFLPGSTDAGRSPRFALGAVIHDKSYPGQPNRPDTFYEWSRSGLYLFEVDVENGRLVEQGAMVVETADATGRQYPIYGDDRSVLAGDAVFYVHGNELFTAPWDSPSSWQGPK